ncbi:MarR family transcriptional regulator [Myxococcus stipitatus DSM 14675]|uniref:MarR family transcriptional regulator n=1 Tax=Myxococcus stipitatus (strain DSM 14675 / JCM 12634 / Mx s8) TaxID=1278073 RepID=L7UG53_MYXSD|nr:MarR family winged helix-turn-helix transcriptional regulator [Myxococcus stipitatus]AGC46998.1 MarR family transcriptional regulator [Myxococcus stipitatus DSM 14675]
MREVMDGIRRIVRLLRVSAKASERVVGISGAQLFVLQQLAEGGPCSINALAERTLTHQSSVSVVVARLLERGLATRRASEEDGRRVEVALAPAGRALLREAPAMAQARLISGLRRLPPTEREGLARGLSALVRELGLDGKEATLFFEDEPAMRRTARVKQAKPRATPRKKKGMADGAA